MLRERVFFSLCVATYAPAFTRVPYVYVVYVFFFFYFLYMYARRTRLYSGASAHEYTPRARTKVCVGVIAFTTHPRARIHVCVVCMYVCLPRLPACLSLSVRLSCLWPFVSVYIYIHIYTYSIKYVYTSCRLRYIGMIQIFIDDDCY